MEFFNRSTNIAFMKKRRLAIMLSIFLALSSALALWINGLNLGLDFTGGIQVRIKSEQIIDLSKISKNIEGQGIEISNYQSYSDLHQGLLKFAPNKDLTANKIRESFLNNLPDLKVESIEFIGPQVGQSLISHGVLALLLSLIITIFYIAARFEYRFAISAAISMLHDPILILGVFALFRIEFNLVSLAAVLTILGYSLNDTIVVYDRIRENFRHLPTLSTEKVIDLSINQTLSRTIMTSGLTLVVVFCLLIFGGQTLFGFALALAIGIIIGTYSSIYVASGIAFYLGLEKKHLIKK